MAKAAFVGAARSLVQLDVGRGALVTHVSALGDADTGALNFALVYTTFLGGKIRPLFIGCAIFNVGARDADNYMDYLGVVHVFMRRPHLSRQALYQVRETDRTDHSAAGLADQELTQGLISAAPTGA